MKYIVTYAVIPKSGMTTGNLKAEVEADNEDHARRQVELKYDCEVRRVELAKEQS